jgi:hypothetical protein
MFITKVNIREGKVPIISSLNNTSRISAIIILRTILRHT